jgi:hypothetical protein
MVAVWKVVIKNKLSPTTLLLLVKPEARAWGEPGILVLLSVATGTVTVHYNKLSQFP